MQNEQLNTMAVIANPVHSVEYNLYLSGIIESTEQFLGFYSVLKEATESDVVRLHINSGGGCLSSALELIRHMQECAAPIIACIGVECASASTIIALACDNIEVNDYSCFLIHSLSFGQYNSAPASLELSKFNDKLNTKLVTQTYKHFLTDEQMEKVLRGADLLLDADEIVESWNRRADALQQEHSPTCNEAQQENQGIPQDATHYSPEDEDFILTYWKQVDGTWYARTEDCEEWVEPMYDSRIPFLVPL